MVDKSGALRVWFGGGQWKDARLLRDWRDSALTYTPGQEVDYHWCLDRYEIILGQDTTGDLFHRAAGLALTNQIYPPEAMICASDFELYHRPVRPGDRVVQRIHAIEYITLPILDVLAMDEVTRVIDEPRQAGLTFTTTQNHWQVGEWSPTVEWRENGEVALVIEAVSRIRPGLSFFARRLARRLQLRAHRLGIDHFLKQLAGEPYRAAEHCAVSIPRLAPLAFLLAAAIVFTARLSFSRRTR